MKTSFDDYFSFNSLARYLAKLRARVAFKRHALHSKWSLLNGVKNPSGKRATIEELLPPRRMWHQHRPRKEKRGDKTAMDITSDAIYLTVITHWANGTLGDYDWGRKLCDFFERLQRRVKQADFTLSPPTLCLIKKSPGKISQLREMGTLEFRCLSSYKNLEERVLISGVTAYIRDVFDSQLSECCYAFRSDSHFTHTAAVQKLIEVRKKHLGEELYTAECDIQKFFDVIHHDVVLKAYDSFANRVENVDPRARQFLMAYLNSYSFRHNLLSCEQQDVKENLEYIPWVNRDDLAPFYQANDLDSLPLGIPQGGALSPIIANIVLDHVDKRVLQQPDPNLFYARYCDDIILVHPDKAKCEQALNRYLAALKDCKLPMHPLKKDLQFGREFYKAKSKGPMKWCDPKLLGQDCALTDFPKMYTPWISFLGYQIHYDGDVRIRKSTLSKHADKITEECNLVLREVQKEKVSLRPKVSTSMAWNAFTARIVAAGVGRNEKKYPNNLTQEICWMAAFPLITNNVYLRGQLRRLDHMRSAKLAKLKKGIEKRWSLKNEDGVTRSRWKYPHSYFGRLHNAKRRESPTDRSLSYSSMYHYFRYT